MSEQTLNIYHVSQEQNTNYDTYSDFVICAPDEESAMNANPLNGKPMTDEDWGYRFSPWCNGPEHVTVRLIGMACVEAGLICSSYHAG